MSNRYPLSPAVLQEEFDLLMLKLDLVNYMRDESRRVGVELKEMEEINGPDPETMVNRAFRADTMQETAKAFARIGSAVFTRVAVVFLIFAITLSTAFAVSPTVRDMIYRMLFSVEERYTLVRVVPQETNNAYLEPEAYTNRLSFVPTYIPEGYELVEEVKSKNMITTVYACGNEYIQFREMKVLSDSVIHVDSENSQISRLITINNNQAILNIKDDQISIAWQVSGYLLDVTSNGDAGETICFAQNIRIVE